MRKRGENGLIKFNEIEYLSEYFISEGRRLEARDAAVQLKAIRSDWPEGAHMGKMASLAFKARCL